MPTPPNANYPQDGHAHPSQIHSHLQPGTQQGYYQHVLHKQPSPHLMPPPPLPLDPSLVGSHHQLANPHSPVQGYVYPSNFNQPHQQPAQSRPAQMQYPINQQTPQFPQSQEPDLGSDDEEDEAESDEEPVAGNAKGKKRGKSNGGAAAKKAKQAADDDDDGNESGTPASGVASKPKSTRGSRSVRFTRYFFHRS